MRPVSPPCALADLLQSTAIADDAAESSLDLMERRMLELEQRLVRSFPSSLCAELTSV